MIILPKNTKAILITGPTASGKSLFALKLASELNGEVINADSMQVYDTLCVLTSRPSVEQIQCVPHSLYGHVSAHHAYSTGQWLHCAIKKIKEVQKRDRLPIVVGGTGLYFRALTGNFSVMPPIPNTVRKAIRKRLEKYGPHILHEELFKLDSISANRINRSDGQRIARALEIFMVSGQSITELWKSAEKLTSAPAISSLSTHKIIILPERSCLQKKIRQRFQHMLDKGAVDEVKDLMAMKLSPDLPIMKAIGVRDIMSMLRGEIKYEEALQRGITATNRYAKRQITWFCHQFNEDWERVSSVDDFI
ncbi:tRNA (adenosine(37)-N6)-dimethylallyltransferase MiaA [Candidatus Liberibacter sp.]|uniref:tRNA (adenosine(37)-N6)-dimethylallyltransferase MiaA n=1 Tax=Candidatus Liberibacter sp. TaxID=34022 RepID=UPI0015F4C1A3|nr:tRNA (adenosine(37)-N6)-dimethylallyltransferase MiaA [Candidatus Liberibacter sp.]MBA5724027.1 tRNA (adenosine(37)-N6)-dimethylallyltransferase MiaA [Candidatus Liberibacter sp.]